MHLRTSLFSIFFGRNLQQMKQAMFFLLFPLFPLMLEAQIVSQDQIDSALNARNNNLLAFPLIYYQPETSWSFGAGAIYYFRVGGEQNRSNNLSTARALFLYTLEKQLISELNTMVFFRENDHILLFRAGYDKYPYRLYGIGNDTREEAEEFYTDAYPFLSVTFRKRLWRNLYGGLLVDFNYNRIIEKEEGGLLDDPAFPGADGGLNWGPGLQFTWDSRDDVYYPYRGWFADLSALFVSERLGSDFEYQRIRADIRKFIPFATHILALNAYLEMNPGSPPFNHMAMLGGPFIMRGFFKGRFRDRHYYALQAAYRFPVWWRFRGAVFANAGDVANDFNEFSLASMKYGFGLGIRLQILPTERVYLRFDAAFGTGGSRGFYLQFTEAF